jgi:hypothetical protein
MLSRKSATANWLIHQNDPIDHAITWSTRLIPYARSRRVPVPNLRSRHTDELRPQVDFGHQEVGVEPIKYADAIWDDKGEARM